MTKKLLMLMTFVAILIGFTPSQDISAKESRGMTQQTLPVSYDNEVHSGNPDTVYANRFYVTVGHWDYYNSSHRYYLFVDLSSLPKDAQIQSAELILNRVSESWDQDGLYELHQVQAPWQTTTLTWNNQPIFSDEFVVPVVLPYSFYKFNVTDWLSDKSSSSDQQFGFVLKKPFETGNNNGLFTTADYSPNGAQTRPYMVVTY